MRTIVPAALILAALSTSSTTAAEKQVRLFILSGQSNMAGLKPEVSFTPEIQKAFPGDEIIVVKSAQGGQPIRRWYKNWKPPEGKKVAAAANGDLYDVLLKEVKKAVGDKKPDTVSFVWMQGERDAKEGLAAVYRESLRGLVDQLQADLGRRDITVVIGRLSDCDMTSEQWKAVRAAQVAFGEKEPLAGWVDTDDLNGDNNGLHYTRDGYAELGRRFAAKTIELLRRQSAR